MISVNFEKNTLNKPKISIITATYNAEAYLPQLISSLRQQTDQDFEWVVADGVSTDATLSLLTDINDLNVVISSISDFGIYDALNRGINLSTCDYYVVAGADDFFMVDAIANYRKAIMKSGADIIVAKLKYGNKEMQVKRGPSWLFAQSSFVAGHTLATAFKKELHQIFGQYSRKFPIAGDQFFVLSACKGGASIYEADFVAGEMGMAGVSSIDRVGGAVETFRVQVVLGSPFLLQFMLLTTRFIRLSLFNLFNKVMCNK